MVHLLLVCSIKVIKPGWKAGEERGTRATLLQLSGNLVHTVSTLPDVHKAKESLMLTGMFYVVFSVCGAKLLGDYFTVVLVVEGRSLG